MSSQSYNLANKCNEYIKAMPGCYLSLSTKQVESMEKIKGNVVIIDRRGGTPMFISNSGRRVAIRIIEV